MVNTPEILRNSLAYTEMGEHAAILNVSEGTGLSFIAERFKESMFLRTVFEQHIETKFQYTVRR
jgi:hypothetical protein